MSGITELRKLQAAAGAAFGPDGRPESFGDPEAEARAARSTAALFDLTGMTAIEAAGPDAADYLHRMLSNGVKDLAEGASRRATVLKGDGRMIADVTVCRTGAQRFLLLAPEVCRAALFAHLDKYLITEDAALADLTEECAVFLVRGPAAGGGEAAAEETPPTARPGDASPWRMPTAVAAWKGNVWAVRASAAPAVWSRLGGTVAAAGGRLAGAVALRTLRIEDGQPEFGVDMDESTIPLEAGLKDAISFTKGCFPGQEIVARIENLGHPARILVGLTFEAAALPEPGTELFSEGKAVGRVTSATRSAALGSDIGLGSVKWDRREPGTTLALGAADSDDRAAVAELPFVKAEGA